MIRITETYPAPLRQEVVARAFGIPEIQKLPHKNAVYVAIPMEEQRCVRIHTCVFRIARQPLLHPLHLPLPEPQVADRKTGGPFLPPVPTRVNYALRMEQRTRQAISELNARAEHGPAGHGTVTAPLAQPLAIKARERLTPISDNAAGQQLHHQQLEVADLSMGKLFAEFPRRMILVCVPWE